MNIPLWLRIVLTVWVGLPVASAALATATQPPGPPNVIFVLADQWRAQALGYAGDPNVHTPNLDALEKQSVNFVNAISNVPVCSPARASILTGQRALTNGVFMNDVPLDPAAMTLAKALGKAGYETGYIGKWHLNGDGRSAFIPRDRRQGFDYWKALECTHDYNHSFYYADGPEKLLWPGYDAISQTRDAERFVRDHAGPGPAHKPFLLFLAWGPPHDPYYSAPKEYRDLYDAAKISLRPNVPGALRDEARRRLAGYYAHCSALDHCLGELWQTCKDAGIEQNTVLVFSSDHGDLLASHAFYNKQQPYEESARVPLLIHYPARLGRSGRRLPNIINAQDIMPTLLGLIGQPIPKTVQGLDFTACIEGGKDPSDGDALILCPAPFGQWNRLLGGREYRAVRTARYTYARDLKGPWLLFDNERDPYQMHNLVGDAESAELQGRMESLLRAKLEQTGDQFLPGAKYIEKWGYHVDPTGTVPYAN